MATTSVYPVVQAGTAGTSSSRNFSLGPWGIPSSNHDRLRAATSEVDLVIGAVLARRTKAPHIIARKYPELMKQAAVIADVSIGQSGWFETSRPTTHSDPTYEIGDDTLLRDEECARAVPIASTYSLTMRRCRIS